MLIRLPWTLGSVGMTEGIQRFSLVIGGPFHGLLMQTRLLGEDRLPSWRAGILVGLLAWLPSALLAIGAYLSSGGEALLTYFTDYTAYIRCLVAIPIMMATERTAHLRLMPIVHHFLDAGLIDPSAAQRYRAIVKSADDWSASRWVEGLLFLTVILIAVFGARLDIEIGGFPWDGRVVDGEVQYTLAGAWSHWFTKPLFQFLLFRWFFRFAVWAFLLFRISRLPLRLLPYHPDQSGGLGFLSVYPMVFNGLVLVLSSMVAAQILTELQHAQLGQEVMWYLIGGWMLFVLLVFIGPLAVFIHPLFQLRESAIFSLGRMAGEHHLAFQQKWLERDLSGPEMLGSEDVGSVADLESIAASPYQMRTLPVTVPMIVSTALAAGLPMVVLVATQMPLVEFLEVITTIL